jgi:hypothetical protein
MSDSYIFLPPAAETHAPLLALLPLGERNRCTDSLASSLYARYENTLQLKETLSAESDPVIRRHTVAEEEMLRVILEFLDMVPQGG